MKIIDWFKVKRVFPRWKLIVIVVIGVWVGLMIEEQPIFAIIFGLLGVWEFSKKGKPFD